MHFALLSDWADADAQTQPGDDAVLDIAILGIARLNRRYGRRMRLSRQGFARTSTPSKRF